MAPTGNAKVDRKRSLADVILSAKSTCMYSDNSPAKKSGRNLYKNLDKSLIASLPF